jgi:predicted transposase YdaD
MSSHDATYKSLFSCPEVVRDLIAGFVPDAWLQGLDYTTLEKLPSSYITEDFSGRADDVVWRVKVGEDWVYLYLLIEFQSTVDQYMALRMMVYVGLLYQDLIKRKQVLKNGRLPPVLPIVLYNGSRKWTAPTDIADLLPVLPDYLGQFKPSMKYLLIDENAYSENELVSLKNLVAAVFRIEHPANPESIQALIGLLDEWLVDNAILRRTFARWIRATLMQNREYRIMLPEVNDLQELRVVLSEKVKEWALRYRTEGIELGLEQGLEKGLEKGLERGRQKEAEMLLLLLRSRFRTVPESIELLVRQANADEIEAWFQAAVDADTLELALGIDQTHH